jgi:hypothetical protein
MRLFGIQMENAIAYKITMKCIFFTATLIIPLAIYQTHAMDGTISWLSLAHLVCYLHGQEFLILQHKTLTLLADQQFLDIALSIALE